MTRRATFKTALAASALAALFATPTLAANACKNVYLEFGNRTGGDINVVDVDYWDPAMGSSGGWRSEPVVNETISNGGTWREVRNLEKVNQRTTKVRFEYRIKGKFGGWSVKKYSKTTGTQTCSSRMTFSAAAT